MGKEGGEKRHPPCCAMGGHKLRVRAFSRTKSRVDVGDVSHARPGGGQEGWAVACQREQCRGTIYRRAGQCAGCRIAPCTWTYFLPLPASRERQEGGNTCTTATKGVGSAVKRKECEHEDHGTAEVIEPVACAVKYFARNKAPAVPCPPASLAGGCGSMSKRQISRTFTSHFFILLLMSSLCCPGVRAAIPGGFTTKAIGQSNPLTDGANTITVTLVTDTDVLASDSSVVTISGLLNAIAESPITLIDAGDTGHTMFSDGSTQGKGAWSSGTLTLTVHTNLTAGANYTLAFQITNPSSVQPAQTISIAASGAATFELADMSVPGVNIFGVTGGANPLLVVEPTFNVKSIQQNTPLSGSTNTITVTLTANIDLADGSSVTILGLTGSQTNDASLTVTSTSGLLGVTGTWTKAEGKLVLTAEAGGTSAGAACEVKFNLMNSAQQQSSLAVSVVAAIKDGSSNSVGSIAQAAMTKPGTTLYGVANGADPLTVEVPAFSVKSIQQNTPLSGSTNTITVTLTANIDLADGSSVTILGLTGSQTNDASLTVTSTSGLLGVTGTWTKAEGKLVLTAEAGGTSAGAACEVKFNLMNSAQQQSSLAVSVVAAIKDGSSNSVGSIAQAAMTKPGTTLYGVANGADPLTVEVPAFSVKSIQQSSTSPGALNSITITLTTNFNLPDGSTVTILGLIGSLTASSSSLSIASTSSILGIQGVWTQDSGVLLLTAESGGMLAATPCTVTFSLTNPESDHTSPLVRVEASIIENSSPVAHIALSTMTKPEAALCGVENGAAPLTVLVYLSCPGGTFPGETQCETCPAGYFCNINSTHPLPCPAGTEGRVSGLASVSHCVTCATGYIAPSAGSANCTQCPAGYSCPTPSSIGSQCSQGYYSLSGQQTCIICPAGYSCAIPSQSPQRCPEGYFSPSGAPACDQCEAGKFCPLDPASSQPVPCPDGEYSSNGRTTCSTCSPGYYAVSHVSDNCTLLAGRPNCTRCPAGHSCEANGEPIDILFACSFATPLCLSCVSACPL